jgi:hypothetical protein
MLHSVLLQLCFWWCLLDLISLWQYNVCSDIILWPMRFGNFAVVQCCTSCKKLDNDLYVPAQALEEQGKKLSCVHYNQLVYMILKMLPSLLSGCVMQVPLHWLMFHITFTHCQELMKSVGMLWLVVNNIHVRRSMNICATSHSNYSLVFVSGLVFLWLDYLSCTLFWILIPVMLWDLKGPYITTLL